ncbi:FliM/FliN family flagellar motor switch protein [Arcobacteraceae bacterium]|nr:FliM/FliN family flagellar motor switch protein [Arcobacteraceae bacterium]
MASDISNIIKSEISSTLESLLSASSNVEEVVLVSNDEIENNQCISTEVLLEFAGKETHWNYYIPAATATQFEYLMLGGVTDLKDSIDDEITDAVKEIISTISGSISTSVNAQNFSDLTGVKSTLGESTVLSISDRTETNKIYKFIVKLNDDNLEIYVSFDSVAVPFVKSLTEDSVESNSEAIVSDDKSTSIISSLLGEESVDNLRLLFDIKMRLSVRLGTKICLLRDVISWDIGEIIELSQMTNEPLDILINGVVVGSGEAIIVDGKFGVKIKHIGKIN